MTALTGIAVGKIGSVFGLELGTIGGHFGKGFQVNVIDVIIGIHRITTRFVRFVIRGPKGRFDVGAGESVKVYRR